MSRLDHLAPRDLERLSAYLDGDLAPQEGASLRARLEVDPELRLSLEEIQQVVSAVRGMGEIRVPRNFTLRAADAARRREPGFAVLRFATVLATALFVLTTAVRTVSAIPMQLGAAAPVAESATAAAQEMFANVAGAALPTNEPLLEALATAPAAAAPPLPAVTATPASTLGAAAVLSPAPTSAGCPSCPPSLKYRQEAPQDLEDTITETTGEEAAPAPEILGGSIGALAVAQWVLGVAAVILGILMVRARRSR